MKQTIVLGNFITMDKKIRCAKTAAHKNCSAQRPLRITTWGQPYSYDTAAPSIILLLYGCHAKAPTVQEDYFQTGMPGCRAS